MIVASRGPAVAILLALSLTACDSGSDIEAPPNVAATSQAPPPSAAPSSTPNSATATYAKVRELIGAMGDGGVRCEDVKILKPPQQSIKDFGLCFVDGEMEFETDIYVFGDMASRDSWLNSFAEYPDVHTLLGENWFITSGSVEELTRIQAAVGGAIDPLG